MVGKYDIYSQKNAKHIIATTPLDIAEIIRLEAAIEVASYDLRYGTAAVVDGGVSFDIEAYLHNDELLYENIRYEHELQEGFSGEEPLESLQDLMKHETWCHEREYWYSLVTDVTMIKHKPVIYANAMRLAHLLDPDNIQHDPDGFRRRSQRIYHRILKMGGTGYVYDFVAEERDIKEVMICTAYLITEGKLRANLTNNLLSLNSLLKINGPVRTGKKRS